MAFYDKFEELCKAKGVTPTRAARENGLTQSVISMWKTRGSTPKAATVQKLADYFGVTVNQLLGLDAVIEKARKIDRSVAQASADALISMANKGIKDIHEFQRARLSIAFEQLNATGRRKAIENVEDLAKIPEYQKKDEPTQK